MRILFVAMADTVHAARWLSQFDGLGWDLHLVPTLQREPPHRRLRDVTLHDVFRHDPRAYDPSVRQAARLPFPLRKGRTRAAALLARATGGRLGYPGRIAALVRSLRPDVVHAMEMQQGGYHTADAKALHERRTGTRFPPLIVSCWGNDIYHFRHQPAHVGPLRRTLAACDYFLPDCERDVGLARDLGLRAEVPGVFPVVGGYDLAGMRRLRTPGPASARRVVAIKGYSGDGRTGHPYGRGLVAVRAVRACAGRLAAGGYEVVVHSWGHGTGVREEAEAIARDTGVRVTFMPPSPNEEIVRLLGRARVAVGLSISDGTPNVMLEAMTMGAFPVQSDTGSTGEWIAADGRNGRLVPAEDVSAVAAALGAALSDDALVDRADAENGRAVERIDRSVVWPQIRAMYERAARLCE